MKKANKIIGLNSSYYAARDFSIFDSIRKIVELGFSVVELGAVHGFEEDIWGTLKRVKNEYPEIKFTRAGSSYPLVVQNKAHSSYLKIIFKVFNFLHLTIINDRPFSFLLRFLIKKEKFAIIIAKIPAAILYPIIREILYWEYLLLNFKKRLHGFRMSVFSSGQSHNADCLKNFREMKKPIDRPVSLRVINNELKQIVPAAASLTEQNQRILYEGR